MRTATLWLVGVVTVGFLATLWPLPTTIAHETVEAARAQGTALSDDAAARLAEAVASGLWPWWIANLVVKGSPREAFVVFHRLISLTFFTLGLLVYLALGSRREVLFVRG